jgi:phosphate transport system substrate-binding protein
VLFRSLAGLLAVCNSIPAGAADEELIIQGEQQVVDVIEPGLSAFDALYPGNDIQPPVVPDESPEQNALSELKAGNIDIAAVGRALSASDDPTGILNDLMIGRQSVVMIVNSESALNNISYAQLKAIYEGSQTSWSQLGGTPLVPRAMQTYSGLYLSLVSSQFTAIDPSLEETVIDDSGLPRLDGDADMAAEIGVNPDQIGYIGFGFIPFLDSSVRCLNLRTGTSGSTYISPLLQNLYDLTYPSLELHLWYQKANRKTVLSDYLEFAISSAGQYEMQLAGGIKKYPDFDINRDGKIDLEDIIAAGSQWNETGDPGWIQADVNYDGMINILDMAMIGLWWEYSYNPE